MHEIQPQQPQISLKRHVWILGPNDEIKRRVAEQLTGHVHGGKFVDLEAEILQQIVADHNDGFEPKNRITYQKPQVLAWQGGDHTWRMREEDGIKKIAADFRRHIVFVNNDTECTPQNIDTMNRSGITIDLYSRWFDKSSLWPALKNWFHDRAQRDQHMPPGLLLRYLSSTMSSTKKREGAQIHMHASSDTSLIVKSILERLKK